MSLRNFKSVALIDLKSLALNNRYTHARTHARRQIQ